MRGRARHDLRGGALPEHRRVLGPRDGDVPDPGRDLHARLPLLLRAVGQAGRSARPAEPLRLAQTAAQMGLSHVVVTSVDRDDIPDRGAGHYAATIRAIRRKLPAADVEILTPDFLGVEEEALATVLDARPDVFGHNIETVRRLHAKMRGAKASYDKALWLLRRVKELADYRVLTKSGIIVGLGENRRGSSTMRDLRKHGVDVVTIGQYLQPSPRHATIDRWVHPDEFQLAPRAGRGTRLRLGLLRPAGAVVVSRGRAAPRRRNRPRSGRVLAGEGMPRPVVLLTIVVVTALGATSAAPRVRPSSASASTRCPQARTRTTSRPPTRRRLVHGAAHRRARPARPEDGQDDASSSEAALPPTA